jgi:hypothetical protein
MFSVHFPNNYCKFDSKIFKIVKIKEISGGIILLGQVVTNTEPFFQFNHVVTNTEPFFQSNQVDSEFFGIVCSASTEHLEPVTKQVRLENVKTKVVKVEATIAKKHIVYIPYLHCNK